MFDAEKAYTIFEGSSRVNEASVRDALGNDLVALDEGYNFLPLRVLMRATVVEILAMRVSLVCAAWDQGLIC